MAFQGTFGLEVTDQGLVTFGSALPFGSGASQNQPILTAAMPVGVTYQQLRHPVLTDDGSVNYNNNVHRMTKAISCNFNGKAFVIVTFTDGNTFLYYNGTIVDASRNGKVLSGKTSLANLGTDLARIVNSMTSWRGVANTDAMGNPLNGQDQVYSPTGVYFGTPTHVNDSVAGLQAELNVPPNDGVGTAGISALAEFQISNNGTTGVSTFQLQAPKNKDGTGSVDLCGGPVTAAASATLTATAIANAVNANTLFTGYYALHSGPSVGIFAQVAWGNFTFNLTVTAVGGTAATTASSTALTLTVAATPSSANFTFHNSKYTPSAPKLSATGGTLPYTTYAWVQVNADGTAYTGPFPVAPSSPSSPTLGALHNTGTLFGWTATLYFKGSVTDSNPTTGSVIVPVNVSP